MIPSQKSYQYKCDVFSSPRSFNGSVWEFRFMHMILLIYFVNGFEIVSCEFPGCETVSCEIVVVSLSVASFGCEFP